MKQRKGKKEWFLFFFDGDGNLQNKEEKTKKQEKEAWRVLEIKLESCGTSRDFFNKKDGEGGERGVVRLERNGNVN